MDIQILVSRSDTRWTERGPAATVKIVEKTHWTCPDEKMCQEARYNFGHYQTVKLLMEAGF